MSRIAFVTTMAGFPWGGSEIVWARAAEAAVERGDTVLAMVFDWSSSHPAVEGLRKAGVRVVTRPRELRRTLLDRILNRLPGFAGRRHQTPSWLEELREFAPDAVCVSSGIHWECLSEGPLFDWLIGGRVPFTLLVHCNSERVFMTDSMRREERTILGAARPLIFVAQGNLELAERQLAHRFDNAIVLTNSVDRRYEEPLPWPQGDPVFALVARFDVAYKGHDILFEVLGRPEWRDRRWTCRCFGDGPDAQYVRDLVRLYGLESLVDLAGHVADVRSIWANSQLCVLPSRAEGTPLALLEAFAAGRPAVVTDVGGNAEWTEEGETGFIAEAATPRSFAAALERAWQARDRWQAMGRTAWERSTRRLDPNPGRTLLNLIETKASR